MSKIIERIQKLLRLAQNAGSEEEAALAAQRAADMMAQYEIHEAQLSVEDPTEIKPPEPIERAFEITNTVKKVAWHMRIVYGVAQTYGTHAYWRGGRVVVFGRLSAVQATNYTSQYLMRMVEQLTDKLAPTSQYSKTYRNSFRLGLANRIEDRIVEAYKQSQAAMAVAAATETVVTQDDLNAAEDESEENSDEFTPVAPTTMALAVVDKQRKEVDDLYQRTVVSGFSKRRTRAGRRVSNGSGYAAGRAAGDTVDLSNSAKGALPKGQDTLKKGAA